MPVFISHSHEDQPSYTSLCLALDGAGVERWDPSKLALGHPLAEQLRRAIKQCEICIFQATARSLRSRWCLAELGAFWGAGKKVIVYIVDPEVKESDIPPQFQGNLWTKDAKQVLDTIKKNMSVASRTTTGIDDDMHQSLLIDSQETGVKRIFHNRLAIDLSHDAQNEKINSARVVNISSLVFNVRQSRHLKRSLKQCVMNGGRVRILLSDPNFTPITEGCNPEITTNSTHMLWPFRLRQYAEKDLELNRMPSTLRATLVFLDDLYEDLRTKSDHSKELFEVRLLSQYVMYSSMMQIDETMLLTLYCNKEQGNGSPTLRLKRASGEHSLFMLFEEEFEYLWNKARPAPRDI